MAKPAKNTICLWYDKDAEEAARFTKRHVMDVKRDLLRLIGAPGPAGNTA